MKGKYICPACSKEFNMLCDIYTRNSDIHNEEKCF